MITIWVPKRLVEIDLYNVAARSPQALAQLSENSYARRVQYAAQKVRGSGAKIVMLTGPSASGKTTSAHCLAKALVQQGTPAQVVSLDNFFKGAAYYPKMPDGTLDYENLETLDLPLIKQCLRQLSETGKTELPIYDFATEQRSAEVEPIDLQGGVCIVEGIHALNPELTGLVPDDQIYRIYAGLLGGCSGGDNGTDLGGFTVAVGEWSAVPYDQLRGEGTDVFILAAVPQGAGLEHRCAVRQSNLLDRRRGEHLLAADRLIPPGVHGTDIVPGGI